MGKKLTRNFSCLVKDEDEMAQLKIDQKRMMASNSLKGLLSELKNKDYLNDVNFSPQKEKLICFQQKAI